MYLDLFNLRDHPFRLTPDADYLYLSDGLTRAKACMERSTISRGSIVLITGEVGCGKTALVNRFLSQIPADVTAARLTQTYHEVDDFLQALLSQFGLQPFQRGSQNIRSLLDNFLFAQSVREQRVLLILEEAQNLTPPVIKQLCELAELEEDGQKLISVVLVGQPKLLERMSEKELRKLALRAECQAKLGPLSPGETTRLIEHRLLVAGQEESPFDENCYTQIYRYTGGIPRLVVNLCDIAMTAAYVDESEKVTVEHVDQAIGELKLAVIATETDAAQSSDQEPTLETRPVLSIAHYNQSLGDFEIIDTRIMLGRDSDNDIVLASEFISRHHAQITMDPQGRYWVKDLNSTNGIFVNGKKAARSVLGDGDVITIGKHQLLFRHETPVIEQGSTAALADWRATHVLDDEYRVDDDRDDSDDNQVSNGQS